MYELAITLKTYKPSNFKKIYKFLTFIKNKYSIQKLNTINSISLKKKIKNFTVLKSPHVHKKSREHFQYKVNKKLYSLKSDNLLFLLYINYIFSQQIQTNCITTSTITSK